MFASHVHGSIEGRWRSIAATAAAAAAATRCATSLPHSRKRLEVQEGREGERCCTLSLTRAKGSRACEGRSEPLVLGFAVHTKLGH